MIDKHVPLPRPFPGVGQRKSKYRWRDCQDIGDSFIADEKDLNRVQYAMRKFCQRNKGYMFHAEEVGAGQIRVWRVK